VEFVPPTPFGKTGNYWPHFLALPASGDDALLVAPSEEILGAAMGNIFLVIRDELVTPAHPVRKGVVRDWILDRFPARELPLTRADLPRATAAFVTNSRLGISPLSAIDGEELPGDSVVEAIASRYRTEVLRVG
jgi:branched-subunit amino acid aminotransferase/4-amino-4-deoxychorismate lyase